MLEKDVGLDYFARHQTTIRRATTAGKLDFTELAPSGLLTISDLVEDEAGMAERARAREKQNQTRPMLNQPFVTFE